MRVYLPEVDGSTFATSDFKPPSHGGNRAFFSPRTFGSSEIFFFVTVLTNDPSEVTIEDVPVAAGVEEN